MYIFAIPRLGDLYTAIVYFKREKNIFVGACSQMEGVCRSVLVSENGGSLCKLLLFLFRCTE